MKVGGRLEGGGVGYLEVPGVQDVVQLLEGRLCGWSAGLSALHLSYPLPSGGPLAHLNVLTCF